MPGAAPAAGRRGGSRARALPRRSRGGQRRSSRRRSRSHGSRRRRGRRGAGHGLAGHGNRGGGCTGRAGVAVGHPAQRAALRAPARGTAVGVGARRAEPEEDTGGRTGRPASSAVLTHDLPESSSSTDGTASVASSATPDPAGPEPETSSSPSTTVGCRAARSASSRGLRGLDGLLDLALGVEGDADDRVVLAGLGELHAHRVAAGEAHLVDPRAHDVALLEDHEHLVVLVDGQRPDEVTALVGQLGDGDAVDGAALDVPLRGLGALGQARLEHDEHVGVGALVHDRHRPAASRRRGTSSR